MGGIKMKEFNLEEFKKNPSQKVVTRDGRSVRIVCTDAKNEFPIVALVTNDDKEVLMDYNNNGKVSPDEITDLDLFFATEKKDKFDPNTLKPFDRVLVRNCRAYKWKCEQFSYFNEGNDCPCMGTFISYAFCVPYNDETKHILGTSDEAPEYYRWWDE